MLIIKWLNNKSLNVIKDLFIPCIHHPISLFILKVKCLEREFWTFCPQCHPTFNPFQSCFASTCEVTSDYHMAEPKQNLSPHSTWSQQRLMQWSFSSPWNIFSIWHQNSIITASPFIPQPLLLLPLNHLASDSGSLRVSLDLYSSLYPLLNCSGIIHSQSII